MAINRVTGPLLKADLDRQGVDLQFTTNNSPLLYLDFANFRASINANTLTATETLTINGNLKLSNLKFDTHTITSDADLTLATTGNLYLGNIANLKVGGGGADYILSTDGAGNLAWQTISSISAGFNLTANNIPLGNTTDGSLVSNSAYRRWSATTTVADAADNLNQVMLNVYQHTYVGNVSFTANTTAGPSPLSIQFTGTAFGNPDSYFWDFGDGNTSVQQSPSHTFANTLGGSYSIYFKAFNSTGTLNGTGRLGTGGQGSYYDILNTNYITLYTPAPIPSFSLSSTSINDTTSIQLTNTSQNATSYEITWGDGNYDLVATNTSLGGPNGNLISHSYTNTAGDTLCNVTVSAYSSTSGPSGTTVVSAPTAVRIYSGHTPVLSSNVSIGNNQHFVLPNGMTVAFLNSTATKPGYTTIFANNRYEYNFGDGTQANVNIGSGSPGDTTLSINHVYTLIDPKVQQVFNANLQVFNSNTTSPFVSNTVSITVKPAPTALFTTTATITSDRTGDTVQTGYLFTDLTGANRAQFTFTNQSFNTNVYTWTYGDVNTLGPINEGAPGTPTGGPVSHTYVTTGNISVSLLSTGTNSISLTDDTLTKTNYLQILPTPTPPAGVGSQILTIPSIGTTPLLAANATNNSTVSLPAAGTTVARITGAATTGTLTGVYDSAHGTLTPIFNGVSVTIITMDLTSQAGTYPSLIITQDYDAHLTNTALYPSNFYKIFDGYMSNSNASVSVGHNTYQLSHSTTGTTPVLSFIKDDVTSAPSLDISTSTMTTSTVGTLLYMSGVPYFGANGAVAIAGVKAYNWIGQCYANISSPLTIHSGTVTSGSGQVISTQSRSYSNLDGATSYLSGGIPLAKTGHDILTPYTLGSIIVNINGVAAVTSKIDLQLFNVNGISTNIELTTPINLYSISIVGLNELNIPVSSTLGSGYTNNGVRVSIANGATPIYSSSTNYYTTYPFSASTVVAGTDEAILRFGTVGNDVTNYSAYLPVGPNLSGRTGPQYFRFAFQRQTMSNFTVTYSGKVSGLWIAAPATQIDLTSTLNGWIDATIPYAGAGVPGANTAAGGNGSNGCAKTAGDVVPVGTTVVNRACTLTLGSENSSNAFANQILVTIEIAVGDSLTSVSIS